ncbi:class I SAM-dependent methyltransferase [Chitinophaga barathri]|uniref:Class I SAM-dependent methyltransferase n=1 Tax=Chitinophaga barathri TaxID=1647451 RepID=A0A3N4MFU7_9BACT|nr:class I SAM-dependent methyltransferase [Chitinophaga barathri]
MSTPAIHTPGPATWADLGCGQGLFTRALASLLPGGSKIIAVDREPVQFPQPGIQFKQMDFEKDEWKLPPLHGILMANSLHFVKNKTAFLAKAAPHLEKDHRFLIVEYNTDTSNPWVPYPLSFPNLQKLFRGAGYKKVELLREHPSIYHRSKMYAALIH